MEVHANYLLDLGRLLRDQATEARDGATHSEPSSADFDRGRLFAYYEVLSLMQEQAIAFDLPLADVSLDGLDPDRDLLRP